MLQSQLQVTYITNVMPHNENNELLYTPGPKKTLFCVPTGQTSCYGRRTTCSVREDKVCPLGKGKRNEGDGKGKGGRGGTGRTTCIPHYF